MPVQYYCSGCHKRLSISRKKIGERVACPVCSKETVIPPEDQKAVPENEAITSGSQPQITFADAKQPPEVTTSQDSSSTSPSQQSYDPFFQIARVEQVEASTGSFTIGRDIDDDEEMDLTPMVDVTFLLLIFFMITASFSLEKTIPTPVPDPNDQSSSQPIPQQDELQEKSILIEVAADNSILLDEEPLDDPALLRDKLITLMQQQQKAEALVKVDDAAIQEIVVYVLDTANDVGMQKIRLASRPDN